MSLLKMTATELTNTDVDFVALVKRGANRLPFRITKGDEDMDLYAIGRKFLAKKADATPVIAAIVTRKEDAASPAVVALAKSLGLDVEKLEKSEDGALVTLTKTDASTTDLIVVKMDDKIGVSVANTKLKKGFENFDFGGTAFEGLDGSQGYCVGPAIASALHKGVLDVIVANPDVTTLQTSLTKANDAFNAYLSVLKSYAPAELLKIGAGDATGGAATNQETGDGLDDQANKGKVAKVDAGKNGSGAGFEMGADTGANAKATADDAANTDIDAKPGQRVSGDDSGLDPKLKAKKADRAQMNDDSTNGAQGDPPAKLKARKAQKAAMIKGAIEAIAMALHFDPDGDGDDDTIPIGESAAGEGAAQAAADTAAATARGTADDANAGGNNITGKVKGKTLDLNGVPAKLQAPTTKNDGDAEIGKKGKGVELPDQQSGAGAPTKEVQTLKAGDPIMQAIQALAKSVQDSNAAVTKTVDALAQRVDGVAALAKKTDAALQGTVFNEDGGDHAPLRTQKSEDANAGIPLLDTALSRRRA